MAGQKQLQLKNHIEKMKKEYKPHLKHVKTYVPVFPSLYDSLENGLTIGPRKKLNLFWDKGVQVGDEKVHKLA
jgi:hypothetical protein